MPPAPPSLRPLGLLAVGAWPRRPTTSRPQNRLPRSPSGNRGATGIAANAGALHAGAASTAHTSPVVNAPAGSKWLVTYWADKTSSTTAWAPPAGQVFRSNAFGTSGGHMAGLLVDSGADVSGSTGGLTATANSSSSTALSFSIVLQ